MSNGLAINDRLCMKADKLLVRFDVSKLRCVATLLIYIIEYLQYKIPFRNVAFCTVDSLIFARVSITMRFTVQYLLARRT